MPRHAVFFYGSLRDRTLLSLVLGRDPETLRMETAALPGHALHAVLGEGFPCVVPDPAAEAPGEVLRDVTEAELARVRFFEDEDEYDLHPMAVHTPAGPLEALVCRPRAKTRPGAPWRFEDWPETERLHLTECAREIMALHARGADWSDPGLWPGIRARAAARLAAARAPSAAALTRGRALPPALTEAVARPFAAFFAVETHRLRLPRLAGGLTPPVARAAWLSGDAVTVLPYDPIRDEVLLITQWRAGPHARGDAAPWPIEVIAGRLEIPEAPEAAARREAREEAGLTLGRMERIAAYYASPGAVAEHVTSFVAETDLSEAGGLGGLDAEAEDVLSVVMPFEAAMTMIEAAEVDTGPALVSLLWLARHRDRLRRDWRGAAG